ncbi:MAG: SBDS family ribosome assembly factor [Candidatus Thermoplasmatota archaeon]|nr:SBDS family ribosome assembly factor [Candidatus Thermoplasmatota archaeon]
MHVGKCYGQLSGIGKIMNEEYQKDGSWIGIMEMSATSYNRLEDVLGPVTKGTAETKII